MGLAHAGLIGLSGQRCWTMSGEPSPGLELDHPPGGAGTLVPRVYLSGEPSPGIEAGSSPR